VVSAGPTLEDVDPVRFLGNRSSGKMGFALAERAAARGADVTLVAGPVSLATPGGRVRRVDVRSALDMRDAIWNALGRDLSRADALVMAAAVADHRPVDVNALVEESLNLAYHGARAEKQGFNIALERSFDAAAGEVDLYPQEVTRVLLNIIANGFYAAHKRKSQVGGADFEPMLVASTKSLGDRVEIRVRDNGTGIPPEVKEKMFNPFFTTKPAGEGTGLGLSISHDIIVKQHAGTIAVETQPGQFTEFTIVLPRNAATAKPVKTA